MKRGSVGGWAIVTLPSTSVDAGNELLRMNGKLGVDAALDVPLEQIAQAEFRGGKRRHHSNHRGYEQAKPDRARPHGALPGTE